MGPVADSDVDATTGAVHDHHGRSERTFNPWAEALEASEELEEEERQYAFTVDGLLAGTDYQVCWACRNECGLGLASEFTAFSTTSGLPDVPESAFVGDGY